METSPDDIIALILGTPFTQLQNFGYNSLPPLTLNHALPEYVYPNMTEGNNREP